MKRNKPYFIYNTGIQVGGGGGGGGGGGTTVAFAITPDQCPGGIYTDARLVGKTPVTGFAVFTNEGLGELFKHPDGYSFVSGTGTITFVGGAGNYYIQIF